MGSDFLSNSDEEDETNINYHGAASILEDLLGFTTTGRGDVTKFNTHGLTFMIHGNLKVTNFATDGVRIKGTTEGYKRGALNVYDNDNYWLNGYNGVNTDGISYKPSMCIDSSLSWTDFINEENTDKNYILKKPID